MAMVVNDGLAAIANKVLGVGANFGYGHWGTGTTAVSATQTGLISPATESRVAATSSTRTTGPSPAVTNDTAQYVFRLLNGNALGGATKNITEFGQFNDSASGSMILREVFSAYAIAPQEGIEFTVLLQFERGD